MRFDTVKTIYGSAIESAGVFQISYKPIDNTTINEHFNIKVLRDLSVLPKIGYYMIGLNYEDLINDGTDLSLSTLRHSPNDSMVHRKIPFVLKPIDQDLTNTEREDYFLRVEEVINSETYVAYYGKKISDISDKPTFIQGVMANDDVNIDYMVDDGTALNPVITNRQDIYSDDIEFTAVTVTASITLTPVDVGTISDAVGIMYPDLVNPKISEVALVSGVETPYNGYTEIADAQVAYFVKTNSLISDHTELDGDVIHQTFEVGGMENLITRSKG